jgi:hypothetical protein
MLRSELGAVVNIEDTLGADASVLVQGLLLSGDLMGVGGDLSGWYGHGPAHRIVEKISTRLLTRELSSRPTPNYSNGFWSHLGVDAWRATPNDSEEGTLHTIPVGQNVSPEEHAFLKGMTWVEVPLEGKVRISTTAETHTGENGIVVSPGELFIASARAKELFVNVPVGAVNMELSFMQKRRGY